MIIYIILIIKNFYNNNNKNKNNDNSEKRDVLKKILLNVTRSKLRLKIEEL